jgi:cytochrome c oxidase subunit 2
MKGSRIALITAWAGTLLLMLAQPAAAASTSAELINDLNERLIIVALPITLLVEGILIYAVLKFRNNDEPRPTQENRRLEITWTIATAIVLLFVGFAAFEVMADPQISSMADDEPPEDAVVIEVEGTDAWQWEFTYQNEYEGVETRNELYLPKGENVYLQVSSENWLHMVHIPDLGVKQQAQPGTVNTVSTTPNEVGEYQGYCTEYCGVGHSGMLFEVYVEEPEDFENTMQEQMEASENGDEADAE